MWDQLQPYAIDNITGTRPTVMFLVRLCIDISRVPTYQTFLQNWNDIDARGNITCAEAITKYQGEDFYKLLAAVWIAIGQRLQGLTDRFEAWPQQLPENVFEAAEQVMGGFLPNIPSVSELFRLMQLRDSALRPWSPTAMDANYQASDRHKVQFASGATFFINNQFIPPGPYHADASLFPMVLTAVEDRLMPRTVCDYINVVQLMKTLHLNSDIACPAYGVGVGDRFIQYYMTTAANKIQMLFYVRTCVAIAGNYHKAQEQQNEDELTDTRREWDDEAILELIAVFKCTVAGQPSQHAYNLAAVWQVLQATQTGLLQAIQQDIDAAEPALADSERTEEEASCDPIERTEEEFFIEWPQNDLEELCMLPTQTEAMVLFPAVADVQQVELEFTELPSRKDLKRLILQQRTAYPRSPFKLSTGAEAPAANATGTSHELPWTMQLFDP